MLAGLLLIPVLAILALSGVFVLWGVSLIWRGMSRARATAEHRHCPACDEDMRGLDTLTCPTCKNTASAEIDLLTAKPIKPAIFGGIASIALGVIILFASSYVFSWVMESERLALSPATLAGASIVLIAIAFIARGIYGDRAKGRRRCPKCWYPIRTDHLTCPECGNTAESASHFFRTRRSARLIVIGACCLMLAVVPPMISSFIKGGVVGFVPTPILILGMKHVPDHWLYGGSPGADEDLSLDGRLQNDSWLQALNESYARQATTRAARLYLTDSDNSARYVPLIGFVGDPSTQREITLDVLSALESSDPQQALLAARAVSDFKMVHWGSNYNYMNQFAMPARLLSGHENRLLPLFSHPEPLVQDAVATMSYLNGEPIPQIATHYVQRLSAGYEIGNEGWAAIRYHGEATINRLELLRFVTSRNIRDTMMFLDLLSPQELANPQVMDTLLPHLRQGDAKAALVVASTYASKGIAPDTVIPLICARLGDDELDSHHFLYVLSRYQYADPSTLHFIMLAFNDPRERMRAAAYETLAWHVERFPQTRPLAKGLIASRIRDPDTKARTAAVWSHQYIQRVQQSSPAPATPPTPPPAQEPGIP